MSTIGELKSTLGMGATPSRYNIHMPVPIILRGMNFGNKLLSKIPFVGGAMPVSASSPDDASINVLAKRTTLPEKTIETVDVPHRGAKYVLRGVTQFPNRWDVTFHNTPDLALRRFFDEWMYQIHRHDAGLLPATFFTNNYLGTSEYNMGYMIDIRVSQLCMDQSKTYSIELCRAFPVGISAVDLDTSRPNEVSEFTVTFAYSYWNALKPNDTNFLEKKPSTPKSTFGLSNDLLGSIF